MSFFISLLLSFNSNAADSQKWFKSKQNEVQTNNQVALVNDGKVALNTRYQLLLKAKKSIHIQTFIFDSEESTAALVEVIKKKFIKGIDVKIIVDELAAGRNKENRQLCNELEAMGIDIVGYSPLLGTATNGEIFRTGLKINTRLHEKTMIIDDEVAILGGRNFANEYFEVGNKRDEKWQDTDVIIRGSAVSDISKAFEINYNEITNKIGSLTYFAKDKKERYQAKAEKRSKKKGKAFNKVISKRVQDILSDDTIQKEVRYQNANVQYVSQHPKRKEHEINKTLVNAIEQTESTLRIATAYFVLEKSFKKAITEAVERGVNVEIITNSRSTNDVTTILTTLSRNDYLTLMKLRGKGPHSSRSMVKIYEFNEEKSKQGTLHSKFTIFDDQAAFIGSYNLDPRSAHLNSENGLMIESNETAADLISSFENIKIHSSEITIEQAVHWHSPLSMPVFFEWLFGLPAKALF